MMVIEKPANHGTRLLEWYAVSIKTANSATAKGPEKWLVVLVKAPGLGFGTVERPPYWVTGL